MGTVAHAVVLVAAHIAVQHLIRGHVLGSQRFALRNRFFSIYALSSRAHLQRRVANRADVAYSLRRRLIHDCSQLRAAAQVRGKSDTAVYVAGC